MLSAITAPNQPLELDPDVEPIVLLSEMIRQYLGIPAERSYLYNQKWSIPPGPQAFQVLGIVSDQPFASALSYENNPVTGDLDETARANCRSMIQYELWSRNADARRMRFLALTALHSTACQQLCEKYGFAVAQIPVSFTDLSYNEGAARLNRYAITFAVLTCEAFTRPVEYFDTYRTPNPAFVINE